MTKLDDIKSIDVAKLWGAFKLLWAVGLTGFVLLRGQGCDAIPSPPVPPPPAVDELIAQVGEMRDVEAKSGGKVAWDCDDGVQIRYLDPDRKTAVVSSMAKGRYRVKAWACGKDAPEIAGKWWLVVGSVPPVPPEPVPPPTPPIPQGFRAVLVYESGANMTKEQLAVLYSPVIEKYLTEKCADGKGGWRRLDKDAPTKHMPQLWQNLVRDAVPVAVKSGLPAIVLVSGDKGTTHTIEPKATEAEAMAVLRKWGG